MLNYCDAVVDPISSTCFSVPHACIVSPSHSLQLLNFEWHLKNIYIQIAFCTLSQFLILQSECASPSTRYFTHSFIFLFELYLQSQLTPVFAFAKCRTDMEGGKGESVCACVCVCVTCGRFVVFVVDVVAFATYVVQLDTFCTSIYLRNVRLCMQRFFSMLLLCMYVCV